MRNHFFLCMDVVTITKEGHMFSEIWWHYSWAVCCGILLAVLAIVTFVTVINVLIEGVKAVFMNKDKSK